MATYWVAMCFCIPLPPVLQSAAMRLIYKRRLISLAFCLASGLSLTACSTLGGLNTPNPVYVGSKTDLRLLTLRDLPEQEDGWNKSFTVVRWFYGLIDLPFSFAADTLLLPYTLTRPNEAPND